MIWVAFGFIVFLFLIVVWFIYYLERKIRRND